MCGIVGFVGKREALPILSERLKRLEADGLVSRDYVPTIPPQVSYSLTARGDELKEILNALGATALRWAAEDAQVATGKNPTLDQSAKAK